VEHAEVVTLVVARKLEGRGIGWVDAHLLASTMIDGAALWTADRSLRAVARELRLSHEP
jgi:hypothetical protein